MLILGNKERLVSLIDTIGFDDPDNDTDAKIISELVDKLTKKCDRVHLFVIAVNGQNPRMDGSLVAMLKIFKVIEGGNGGRVLKCPNHSFFARKCSEMNFGDSAALSSPG